MSAFADTGSSRWMRQDRQVFKKAWKEHGKQFRLIHSAVGVNGCSLVSVVLDVRCLLVGGKKDNEGSD